METEKPSEPDPAGARCGFFALAFLSALGALVLVLTVFCPRSLDWLWHMMNVNE